MYFNVLGYAELSLDCPVPDNDSSQVSLVFNIYLFLMQCVLQLHVEMSLSLIQLLNRYTIKMAINILKVGIHGNYQL